MRFLRYVSQSAASFLCMIMVGCAALDDGRSHSETGRTSTPLPPAKDARNLGVPLERDLGLSAAVRYGDTIYVAGQMSYDDKGQMVGVGDLEAQMRQAYANVKKVLGYYGTEMDKVVEEVIYVTDMKTALATAARVRADAYAGAPVVASTLIQVAHLPVPDALVEIKATAKVQPPSYERQGSSESRGSQGSRGGGMGGARRGGMGFPF